MRKCLIALMFPATLAAAGTPKLVLPIDCELGTSCHIQQFVDRDPGNGARDFTCGPLSYDDHKGTDFGLPDLAAMKRGVEVLAAAPGRVRAARDGMSDKGYSKETAAEIQGRDCGNGVVIDHGDGWETQYCHMRMGSIIVARGEQIRQGQPLGLVGMSGRTEYPHLHLSVRHNGSVVDPFDPGSLSTCGHQARETLWQDTLDYEPGGILTIGFSDDVPNFEAIKAGGYAVAMLPGQAAAIVLSGFIFGGQSGDVIDILIKGPDGIVVEHSALLKKTQAQLFRAAGKRRPDAGWTPGIYSGSVKLIRAGQVLDEMTGSLTVR